jgi:uncharacterized glyoxalase superfamily protein PhnB
MFKMKIAQIAYLVSNYDEAIDYFTRCLRFTLVEDTPLGEGKRWVRVAPSSSGGTELLLAEAVNAEQKAHIGNQSGGRVFLFLQTDDFSAEYKHMKEAGVNFLEEPRSEVYGTVVVFEDIYGNKWDLIQPKLF